MRLAAAGPLISSLVAPCSWGTPSHSFQADDLLLAYTDGLVKTRDCAGRQYGTEQLLQMVAEVNPSDLERLIDVLNDDVAAQTGRRAVDDTTVMACRLTSWARLGRPQPRSGTASSPSRDQSPCSSLKLMMCGVSTRCGGRVCCAVLK